jgi:hypothetical protein
MKSSQIDGLCTVFIGRAWETKTLSRDKRNLVVVIIVDMVESGTALALHPFRLDRPSDRVPFLYHIRVHVGFSYMFVERTR